jgi:hypothetical protein
MLFRPFETLPPARTSLNRVVKVAACCCRYVPAGEKYCVSNGSASERVMNMKFAELLLYPVLVFSFYGFLQARPWSGIICSYCAVDWRGTGKTIPIRTTIRATVAPSGAAPVRLNRPPRTTPPMRIAPTGQVASLGAGAFYLYRVYTASHSNLTLLGRCPDETFLGVQADYQLLSK